MLGNILNKIFGAVGFRSGSSLRVLIQRIESEPLKTLRRPCGKLPGGKNRENNDLNIEIMGNLCSYKATLLEK